MKAPNKQKSDAPPKATKKPEGTKAPRKLGKPKQVASPISTGGRGYSFESRVQAVHLIAMCLGLGAHGIPSGNTVTKLTFQGRVYGHNTDDLVVDFLSPQGAPGTLRLQLKRSLTARKSDKVFLEAVGLAWLDFRDTSFRQGRDVLMIAYLPASVAAMSEVAEVTRQAIGTSQADDWKRKIFAEDFSNQKRRDAFSALEAAAEHYNNGEQVDISDLHQFAIHLKFQHYDLDSDSTAEVTLQQGLLSFALVHGKASDHWLKFVSCCSELNDVGGDVDLLSVVRHIGDELETALRVCRTLRGARQAGNTLDAQLSIQPGLSSLGSTVVATLVPGAVSGAFAEAAPPARPSSINKLVSRLLDDVNDLQKDMRYKEASDRLVALGQDFDDFDTYQKALWHLLRGMCRWHLSDEPKSAAEDFLRAAELNDDGPKFAAARIRGHLMLEQVEQALKYGSQAIERFPAAYEVWAAYGNARVVNGAVLEATDIPAEFREQAIAWLIAAGSQEGAENFVTAFELARVGVSKRDSTFFNREALLLYALEDALQNKVNVGLRALPPDQIARLQVAVDAFMPRQESLWSAAQSPRILAAAVANLGYAYLLIGEPQKSLDLMVEARSHGMLINGTDIQIELEARRDLGTSHVAVLEFSGHLSEMSDAALVSFAQAALDIEDEPQLLAAGAEACRRTSNPASPRLLESLRNMRWELLLRTERSTQVSAEVQAAGIDGGSSSIVDLMFAIRAAKGKGKKRQVRKWLDRIIELANETQEPSELHVAAQLLYRSNRYEDSAAIYTRILPPHTCSRLHGELLDCYMRLGHFAKAKVLLDGLPDGWEQDSEIRGLALNLTQMTRDWPKVNALAKDELSHRPNECRSWLLSISASAQCDNSETLVQLIADAPLTLAGSPKELARLASIELQHGQGEKALLRLYVMRRKQMADAEAAALHLVSVLVTGVDLKDIDIAPETVGPGTCVTVQTDAGATRQWTLDPADINELPSSDEFLSANSREAKQLLGKKVGDEIVLQDLFGGEKRLTVTLLISAHRRLIDLSHAAIRNPLAPTKYLTSMQMKHDEDGQPDLATIRQQLERRTQYANQTLDLYKQHHAPLGIIARNLGTDTLELVRSWPQEGPKLEMAQGGFPSFPDACKLLREEERWVVDLSMLTELVTLGHQDLLAFLPDVYVVPAVRDLLMSKLESTANFRQSGTMFSHNGQLGFRENTEADWLRDREFLLAMLNCIDTHCEVKPAYGPIDIEPNVVLMRRIFSDDEYATLLLSLELNASVLSLDDRFRRICAMLGCRGAWPQPFLMEMARRKHISDEVYSLTVLKLLLRRRTFVAINHFDLLHLMAMDDNFVHVGVNSLRDYFADATLEFHSGEVVLFRFLAVLRLRRVCSLELILSLLEHLAEGLFRHPMKPDGWFAGAIYQAWVYLGLRNDFSEEKAVKVLTEAEARASSSPQYFTVDLAGLDRTKLPFGGEPLASVADVDVDVPEVRIPTKKQESTGTKGAEHDLDTPEVF